MNNYELQIAICDDDKMSLKKNVYMTEVILKEAGIEYRIEEYDNATSLLESVQRGAQFQILLLDVMMSEMDGMELAVELRNQKIDVEIIFISGDQETALRGYEVAAARYLVKPVLLERLKEALLYCCKKCKEKKEYVVLTGLGNYKIFLSEIRYVEAFDRGARFYLQDDYVDTKIKMSDAEILLHADRFVLCHRAYMVNISEIRVVRRYEIELKSGELIPVSRNRYNEVYSKFAK